MKPDYNNIVGMSNRQQTTENRFPLRQNLLRSKIRDFYAVSFIYFPYTPFKERSRLEQAAPLNPFWALLHFIV